MQPLSREPLTTKLIDLLDRRGVVLLTSPPVTGKTVFTKLVRDAVAKRAREQKRKDVVVSFSVLEASKEADFDAVLKQQCNKSYDSVMTRAAKGYTVYFVVDEVQILYRKADWTPYKCFDTFWELVQESLNNREGNIRVLMVATYEGAPAYDLLSIPVNIPQELMLGIKELNFTSVEMEEFVDKFFDDRACLHGEAVQRFHSCFARLTGGHIGFCVAAIKTLNEKFLSAIKRDSVLPTAEVWVHLMEQAVSHQDHGNGDDAVFEAIDLSTAVWQGLKSLASEESQALNRFAINGAVDRDNATVKKCIRLGILVETVEGKIEFSCVAMQRCVLSRCIGHVQRAPVPPSTLQDLVLDAFRFIDYENFPVTIGRSLATDDLVESAWQRVFYSAAYCCTPSGVFVTVADFGAHFGSPGWIDFLVQDGDETWGIELLRRSDNLDGRNHCFAADGDFSSLKLADYCTRQASHALETRSRAHFQSQRPQRRTVQLETASP